MEEWILINVCVFPEALGIVGLQNAAIGLLIDQMATLNEISTEHLHFNYANTIENSLLRQLFIDELVDARVLRYDSWLDELRADPCPTDFLLDLIKAQLERLGTHFRKMRSKYHLKLPISSIGGAPVDEPV